MPSSVNKRGLVPVLRFPEFRDKGEWEEKKLGDLSQILRGGSPRPIDEYITSDVNGLNWLKIADVDKEAKYVTYTKEKVLATALSKTREVNPGDLIMSNSMSFGRPYILKIKSCIHDGWIAVTQINEQASRDYLYYLILSPTSQEYFASNAAGSGVQNLNADIIKLLPVLLPKYTEQQKIADCLTSVDELITVQTQKLDAIKTHKKGLMQQLFPAEGEAVPKLRFPEFREEGEWEEKQLKDACEMQAGKFVQASEIQERQNGDLYPCFGGNGLRGYTKTYTHEGTYSLIGRQGALCGNVNLASGRFHATEHAVVTTPKKGVDTNWLFYKLVLLNLNQYATGQAQPGLSIENLERVEIKIPSVLEEQQKIADCLTSIDELVSSHAKKIEALKAHKKGLMQQLFPSAESQNDLIHG